MNYTHDKNQIVFLKDADIISAFNEKNALNEVVLSNGIPSYELFKKTYDELSTYDNNICVYLKDGVNVSVDGISNYITELTLSVNGLSNRVNELCSEISNIVVLSVEDLQKQIISNDNDIAVMSAYLSDDAVHYKGTIALANSYEDPEGGAITVEEKELFGLLITNPLINKNRNYKILKGFVYKATSTETTKYFDIHSADGKLTLTNNAYIIAINDVEKVEDAKVSDFTVINDTAVGEYNLSSSIRQLSTELSTELCACEISVNSLSVTVKNYKEGLSTSIDTLSAELYETSSYLNTQVESIWSDIKGGVNYKGHLYNFESTKPNGKNLDLSGIFALKYNLYNTETWELSANKTFNNGWLYNVSLTGDYKLSGYVTKDGLSIENNDYFIIHDHELSCIDVSSISRATVDIIESVQDDYVRLNKLQDVSALLENDYSTRDSNLYKQLSNEIYNVSTDICLSAKGLSDYIDTLELSVNSLSSEVDRISSELSTELCACEISVNSISDYVSELTLSVNSLSNRVNELCSEISDIVVLSTEKLQKLIVSNDNDISSISSDLSVLKHHYNKTFSEKHYTDGIDISVDVLNVFDSENTANQYTLQFLSGTLVLVKK